MPAKLVKRLLDDITAFWWSGKDSGDRDVGPYGDPDRGRQLDMTREAIDAWLEPEGVALGEGGKPSDH